MNISLIAVVLGFAGVLMMAVGQIRSNKAAKQNVNEPVATTEAVELEEEKWEEKSPEQRKEELSSLLGTPSGDQVEEDKSKALIQLRRSSRRSRAEQTKSQARWNNPTRPGGGINHFTNMGYIVQLEEYNSFGK